MSEWIKVRKGLRHNPKISQMVMELSRDRDYIKWLTGTDPSEPLPVAHAVESTTATECNTTSVSLRNALRTIVTPKFIEITTRIVIAGLVDVWTSVNDAITEDDQIADLNVILIDTWSGIPGFHRAMLAIGWVEELEESLHFPNFHEFNTPAKERGKAQSGAERQKRYREKKKKELEEKLLAESQLAGSSDPKSSGALQENVTKTVTSDVTSDGHKNENREEKNTNTEEEASTAPAKGKRSTKQPKTALEPIQEYSHGVSFQESPTDEQRKHFGLVGFCIPVADGRSYFYRITHIQEMQKMRPDVDFQFELRKIRDYLEANPQKARTCRGMATTLNNWLSRIPVKPIEKPKAIPPEHRKFPQGGVINARPRS